MKDQDDRKPVVVYSGSPWEVELVRSLLENAEIEAYLQDENLGTMAPFYTAPGGAGSVKVVVPSQDYEQARQVIEEFERNEATPDNGEQPGES